MSPSPLAKTGCLWVGATLFVVCGCQARDRALQDIAVDRDRILKNMPVNSDLECVGISVVVEALLNSQRLDSTRVVKDIELARQFYRDLVEPGKLTSLPAQVIVGAHQVPVDSKVAIIRLSSLVTELYESDYLRLIQTEQGRQQLVSYGFLSSADELDRILDQDGDQLDLFLGEGTRAFRDGTSKDSYHAFLVGKDAEGGNYVYDSNDPGRRIKCDLTVNEGVLCISWTCQFRDTDESTDQSFRIIQKDKYFHALVDGELGP